MKKYKYSAKNAKKVSKFGIDLTLYGEDIPEVNIVHVRVKEGHYEEFYNVKSTFIYYIINGEGIFYLNGIETKAEAGDLIVIPPKTKIYYFGSMEMTLTVTPTFDEKNERHVRFIDKSENPYLKKA